MARRLGVRLHTHGSETVEEEQFCKELFGMGPTDYFESTGWLGEDVWMAHCVHMNDSDIAAFARTRTGVAHCPSSNARLAAGIARVPDMLAAGVPVGLGVDGTASNESGELHTELRNALLHQPPRRAPGERRSNARQALRLGTYGGAQVLGRAAEIGSLEAGQARRPGAVEARRPRPLLHRRPGRPRSSSAPRPRSPLSLVNGRQSSRTAVCCTSTRTPSPAPHGTQARRLARIAAQLTPFSAAAHDSGREGRLPAGSCGPQQGSTAAVSGARTDVRTPERSPFPLPVNGPSGSRTTTRTTSMKTPRQSRRVTRPEEPP